LAPAAVAMRWPLAQGVAGSSVAPSTNTGNGASVRRGGRSDDSGWAGQNAQGRSP
jgi:hypothetical protein